MSMGKITRNKTYNEIRHNKLPSTRPRGRPPTRRVIDLDSIPTSRNNNIQQEQHPLPEVRLPARQQGQPPPPPRNNDSSVSYEAGSSTTTTSTIITIKMTTITHTDANNNSTTTTTVTTDISPVTSNTISSDPATVSVETREMPPQIARFPPQITPIYVENNNNSNAINTSVNNSDAVNTNTINADTFNIGTVNATNKASTANTSSTVNTSNAANTSNIADTVNMAANVTGFANTSNPVSTETLVSNNQQQHLAALPLIDSLFNSITSSLGRHTINSTNMERTPSTITINSNGTSSSPVLESSFVDSNTVASDNSYLVNRLSHSPMSNSPIISSNAISRPRYYRLPELNALGTVNDVWNEWNVGLGGNPSIIDLLEAYGTKWATENKETLILRKKLIKEIKQRSTVIGIDEAINELERMRNGNGLSWLSKRFGKKRTLSSAHHNHHHNHHHQALSARHCDKLLPSSSL